MASSQRLLSLDILRGLTVAGMILVNNGWGESFEMLQHSKWNGMTPCDLVFPFFLFIMGISCYLSLVKSEFKPTPKVVRRIIKRTVLLFVIGLFINWFDHAIEGDLMCFGHLRIWAVMQRIALCYGIVSLFALYCNHKYTIHTIIALLVIYTAILVIGNGYVEDVSVNFLAQADLNLFGYDHMEDDERIVMKRVETWQLGGIDYNYGIVYQPIHPFAGVDNTYEGIILPQDTVRQALFEGIFQRGFAQLVQPAYYCLKNQLADDQ